MVIFRISIKIFILIFLAGRNEKWVKESYKETQELIKELHEETLKVLKNSSINS
ncbi:MAG: hypothetical protein ABIM49_06345 [candidate division WOR-3 bacterium]